MIPTFGPIIAWIVLTLNATPAALAETAPAAERWLWSTAYAVPKETTNEGSGYFSLVQGKNGRLYLGAAKYGCNAYLVEFDPTSKKMQIVVDAHKAIGVTAAGFAAQAKIHTRNHVGESGKIYFGTKQGYPKEGEQRTDYLGGYSMAYDPQSGTTRVYGIPTPHHGIISIAPDESRGVAYISTCSDERPIESSHFMILDLKSGAYRDLRDCQHMYAFVVIDWLGRAYHPLLGGNVVRYAPDDDRLEELQVTIDGQKPSAASHLADPESHPINWELSPDRKRLYAVAMSGNELYEFDLTAAADALPGHSLGPLMPGAAATDCRAMCVGPDGVVWAGVAATVDGRQRLHLVSYRRGDPAPMDHGPIAIRNPDYTEFVDSQGEPLPYHHGVERLDDGTLTPRYTIMAICATSDGAVYLTTLAPFTLHEIATPRSR